MTKTERRLRRKVPADATRTYLVAAIAVVSGMCVALLIYTGVYLDALGERVPRTRVERDIVRYEATVQANKGSAESWRAYSAALRAAGEPARAEDVVERGLRATGRAPVLQIEQAYVLNARGKKLEALRTARAGLAAEEKRIIASMARLAKRNIQPKLAGADQRSRIEALVLIGTLEAERDNHDRAIRAYSDALESNPTLTDVITARGYAFLAKGETARARRDFERALKIDASSQAAREGLAEAAGGGDQ
jgi:tetratricopeptide (TPR) repeat protein